MGSNLLSNGPDKTNDILACNRAKWIISQHERLPFKDGNPNSYTAIVVYDLVLTKAFKKIIWLVLHQHCKYIQCNFYSSWLGPNFHCNLPVLFTFNCCSKYSWIIVKLITVFYCNFYIGLNKAINVKRRARLQWKVDIIKNCTYLQCTAKRWMTEAVFLLLGLSQRS